MSETVSAGTAAPSTSASPAGGGQVSSPSQSTNSQTSGKGSFGAPQTPASTGTSQGGEGATQAVEQKFLAEQDLDSYIEHTINGRKEKIKVRDALNGYGLDKVARQRMSEAAQKEHQFRQTMQLMQTDFPKFCEVTGIDQKAFLRSNLEKQKEIAEEVLAREYELQNMDPTQRRNLELEHQLSQIRTQELSVKQPIIDQIKQVVSADKLPKGMEQASVEDLKGYLAARQQEFTAGVDNLSNQLLDAWQKVGLPKEKDFGSWMAQLMLDDDKRAVEHKKRTGEELPPLQPEQAAIKVKERFLNSTRSLFSQMDAPAIHEILGEAIIKKLRDHDVGLASAQNRPGFDNQNRPSGSGASEPKKYFNQIEWREAMGIR